MADIAGAFNRGLRMGEGIGGMFGGYAGNADVAQDAYHRRWARQEVLKNGIGFNLNQKTGEWVTPEGLTPEEEMIGKNAYIDKANKAYTDLLAEKLKMTELRKNILSDYSKIADNPDFLPETKKAYIQRIEASYRATLGDKLYDQLNMNLSERMALAVDNTEAKDIHRTFLINAATVSLNNYQANPTPDNLLRYAGIFSEDPKTLKDVGYTDPQTLSNQLHTTARARVEQERKEKELRQSKELENRSHEERKQIDLRYAKQPTTAKEREIVRRRAALPKAEAVAAKDPNMAYEQGWRMNDDGSLYIDPVDEAPVQLEPFDKAMGKRGAIKAVIETGNQWRDATEVWERLQDPEVRAALGDAANAGYWDSAQSKFKNEARAFVNRRGVGVGDKARYVLALMDKMASKERKEFLGTAVTAAELRTAKTWMFNSGDSFSEALTKVKLAATEGKEDLTYWLDIYKDRANMSPFYKAFGISRFGGGGNIESDADALIQKYGGAK